MYIYVYLHTHIFININLHTCTYIYIHTFTNTCIYIRFIPMMRAIFEWVVHARSRCSNPGYSQIAVIRDNQSYPANETKP